MNEFRLYDKLEILPGVHSYRCMLVFAESRQAADVVARIHHAAILRKLGVL